MKKILITGGTGFIGKRLVESLRQENIPLKLLSKSTHADIETIVCDFEMDQIPSDVFENIDTVFHLAGYAHDSNLKNKNLMSYRMINVEISIKLAKLAIKSGVKTFVFVSSVKAGGLAKKGMVMTENDQSEPDGIYGKTKREAEIQLLSISKKSNMRLTIIRPVLVYGPNVKGNLNSMMNAIKKGWFPPLPDTRNLKSLVHVDDLVRAIRLVASKSESDGKIFNVTGSKSYSSREIYENFCILSNKKIPKWGIPKIFFYSLAAIFPSIRYRVDKLLGDDCHSSEKIKSLGFCAQRTLREMNETSF